MALEEPAPPTPRRSGIRVDYSYAVSLPGVLNIAQMISSICSFVFAIEFMTGNLEEKENLWKLLTVQITVAFERSGCDGCNTWFKTVSMITFCLTGLILARRVIHLEEVIVRFPWLQMEILIGILSTVGHMTIFGRAIAVTPVGIRNTLLSHGITISTFLAIIFYGWGTVLVYRRMIRLSSRPRR